VLNPSRARANSLNSFFIITGIGLSNKYTLLKKKVLRRALPGYAAYKAKRRDEKIPAPELAVTGIN
jgi:hypothetical protein